MVSAIISRVVILVFGTLYPAYASYKAVKTKNVKEYVKWMMYWIVFALFTCAETFTDIFVSWVPFYYEVKVIFVIWLLSPATKGSSILYRKFVHPQLMKREKEIDAYIAKASDKGYTAILKMGSSGFNYATNIVLQTAMKGQTKLVDQLRKSYSMNDIAVEQAQNRNNSNQNPDEDEMDGDEDNRIIEERFQRRQLLQHKRLSQQKFEDDLIPEEEEEYYNNDENESRLQRTSSLKETGTQEEPDGYVSRVETRQSKRTTYSHKEAYHYGTLPRTRGKKSTRTSVKTVNFDEDEAMQQ
ncbi:unnamed protein product [Owenia fusiformis]|uniref:Receptor expression-enhancing protein n=1 Tax=Owenia fusiformis TaxID=6347 RepID=A0A8J1T6B2_OWEFU|nr:unnamed protein product [Owenia fusiformis]